MTPNVQLMREAKASLKGKWGLVALATLVFVVIIGASSFIGVGPIILGGPMMLGLIYLLRTIRINKEEAKLETMFSGFNEFGRAFLTYFLTSLFVTLWMLLLIIPGIIMSYAYAMSMYIIADDKEISALDAIKKSRQMMRGNKWKLFCLQIRFFGWIILGCLSFGIGMFWIIPYIEMANLNFYYDLKEEYIARSDAEAAFIK